jgi:hypothetical protein
MDAHQKLRIEETERRQQENAAYNKEVRELAAMVVTANARGVSEATAFVYHLKGVQGAKTSPSPAALGASRQEVCFLSFFLTFS